MLSLTDNFFSRAILGLGMTLSSLVPVVAQPPSSSKGGSSPAPQTTVVLRLADLEQMALQSNPTLTQAAARIEAAQGMALQAGLYPNPTVGYEGEDIGRGREGERQGVFIEQEIVTAGKLRLSRAKYQQQVVQAEIQAQAQQYRVLNGVRQRFWDAVTDQQLVETRKELLKIAEDGLQTTKELVNTGQANRTDLLEAEVEVQQARAELRAAQRRLQGSWAQLTAVVGRPDLPFGSLTGDLESSQPPADWNQTLCDLLQASPELQFAQAEIVRDQIGLQRELAEPIPNVHLRLYTSYDFEGRTTAVDASVGVRLPLFDRNQGTIRQAQSELSRAHAEVTRVELSLRRRFADASARYLAAWETTQDYRTQILPKTKEAQELLQQSFRRGRSAWPQVLVAARNYAQYRIAYLEALRSLRRAEVEIRGLLLVDGLTEPPGPTPQGHLDAVPKPR